MGGNMGDSQEDDFPAGIICANDSGNMIYDYCSSNNQVLYISLWKWTME